MTIDVADPLRGVAVPLRPKPYRMVVGTRPSTTWLLPGPDAATQLAAKRSLLTHRPAQVLALMPGAQEGVEALVAHLERAAPPGNETLDASVWSGYAAAGPLRRLATAASAVQEDVVVMQRRAGAWRLWAGCVCFPSHWRLADKLGADLDAIHQPVPGYASRLGSATTQAFDRIAADSGIVERFNWILTDTPALFTPAVRSQRSRPAPRAPVAVPLGLWLRTERQTLRSLGGARGVAFTIRTFITPLAELTAPERRALARSLEGVSTELAEYRSAQGYLDHVRAWLNAAPAS